MTTKEVADKLVTICRTGDFEKAHRELYHEEVVSIEPAGTPMPRVQGLDAVRAKGRQFQESLTAVHGLTLSDPIVADSFFSLSMDMDVEMQGIGRTKMAEVCVYKVEGGKVVQEEFFYTPPPMPSEPVVAAEMSAPQAAQAVSGGGGGPVMQTEDFVRQDSPDDGTGGPRMETEDSAS